MAPPPCALPLLFGLMFLLQGDPSQAGDTVAAGRPLSGGEGLVSKRGKFRLGFFQPGTGPLYIPQYCVQLWISAIFWCAAQIICSLHVSVLFNFLLID